MAAASGHLYASQNHMCPSFPPLLHPGEPPSCPSTETLLCIQGRPLGVPACPTAPRFPPQPTPPFHAPLYCTHPKSSILAAWSPSTLACLLETSLHLSFLAGPSHPNRSFTHQPGAAQVSGAPGSFRHSARSPVLEWPLLATGWPVSNPHPSVAAALACWVSTVPCGFSPRAGTCLLGLVLPLSTAQGAGTGLSCPGCPLTPELKTFSHCSLLNAGIPGMHHHTRLESGFERSPEPSGRCRGAG